MKRRRSPPGGPVEVVRPLGVVAINRRRGLRLAIVTQDGHEAVELRHVALSPAAGVSAGSHRFAVPLNAIDAVMALLARANRDHKLNGEPR